ncbi:MAG: glycoside hydrolase family 3 protein [Bacteroidetes bacterium]|nr:glycoside hydrolase family 3 protein [Bacteroidota bacterium]
MTHRFPVSAFFRLPAGAAVPTVLLLCALSAAPLWASSASMIPTEALVEGGRYAAEEADDDSLAIKVGQMLMAGFRGTQITDESPIAKELQTLHLGGVILFDFDVERKQYGRNIVSPRQVQELTSALQDQATLPLFIAIDQEGGTVRRFKERNGFPPTVSHKKLGSIDNVDTTRYHAEVMARSIAVVGVNTNFAPVLDLDSNPDNPVIGKLGRSFSADPSVVTRHGEIMLDAHHAVGLFCAVKHFPGHGSSHHDSHEGFVDVSDTWTSTELEPFAALIAKGKCDMVMTAHIFNRHLDPQYPATLSAATIDGLLRRDLGFDGVVVTDDMMMKAITDHYGLETAIEKAVLAGADILLFANNSFTYDEEISRRAYDTLLSLVRNGRISPERINRSWMRIRALKERLARMSD